MPLPWLFKINFDVEKKIKNNIYLLYNQVNNNLKQIVRDEVVVFDNKLFVKEINVS